jgi:hypothetical protein
MLHILEQLNIVVTARGKPLLEHLATEVHRQP